MSSMMAKLFPIKASSTSRESDPIPGKYIINIAIALMCLRHNGLNFAEDIFKCIFVNENTWIPIIISLKFVSKGPINDIPVLAQIMAWRRQGNKPLSQPMMVKSPTHNASLGLNELRTMVFGRTGTFVILNLFQETQTYIWRRNIVIIISQYWDGTEGWNSSWKRGTHISTTVNTVVVDDLNPCIARASAAMTLTYFSPNIPMIRFRAQLFRFSNGLFCYRLGAGC